MTEQKCEQPQSEFLMRTMFARQNKGIKPGRFKCGIESSLLSPPQGFLCLFEIERTGRGKRGDMKEKTRQSDPNLCFGTPQLESCIKAYDPVFFRSLVSICILSEGGEIQS